MSDNANNELIEQNNNTSIEPYTQYPNLFYELGLDPTELLILINVYSYSKNNKPYLESPSTLSKRLNIGLNTARRKLDCLAKKNMLIKTTGEKGKTNIYKINFDFIGSISNSHTDKTDKKITQNNPTQFGYTQFGYTQIGEGGYPNWLGSIPKLGNNNNKYNNKYNNNIFLLENGKELLSFYTNNIAIDISHTAIQILTDLTTHYSDDDILKAMKKTMEKQDALKDIAFMKYTRGILQNWKEYGKNSKATTPAKKAIKGSEKAHGANVKKVDNFATEEVDWSKFD